MCNTRFEHDCVLLQRVNVRGPRSISVTGVMARECEARGNIKPVLSQNAFVLGMCARSRCHGDTEVIRVTCPCSDRFSHDPVSLLHMCPSLSVSVSDDAHICVWVCVWAACSVWWAQMSGAPWEIMVSFTGRKFGSPPAVAHGCSELTD